MKLRPRTRNIPSAEEVFPEVYYSPKGYWKGVAAIAKLASEASVSSTEAQDWLKKTSDMANLPTGSSSHTTPEVSYFRAQ